MASSPIGGRLFTKDHSRDINGDLSSAAVQWAWHQQKSRTTCRGFSMINRSSLIAIGGLQHALNVFSLSESLYTVCQHCEKVRKTQWWSFWHLMSNGSQPGFGIYHHCNSTHPADKEVPLIHSLGTSCSLLPDPLHGLLATLLWGQPFHSRPFYT